MKLARPRSKVYLPSMVRVRFTRNLQRHVTAPPVEVDASTVASALQKVFDVNPAARGYILEDQGGLRGHIAVFVNGEPITDRARLSDAVPEGAEVYVMQALSGG